VTEAQYPTPISNNVLGQLVQVSPSLKKPAVSVQTNIGCGVTDNLRVCNPLINQTAAQYTERQAKEESTLPDDSGQPSA